MRIKVSRGEQVFKVFNYLILTALALVCLYPFWHVTMASFSDSDALIAHTGLLLWPIEFTTTAYERVFANPNVLTGYISTFKLLIFGVSWQMVMTVLGAYVLSRREFMLRRPLMLAITFTMFFSGGMIPTYLNIQDLGLKGGIWAIIIPFAINTYYLIILRTSFESLPESLLEAAKIDGAGQVTLLLKIVLPLSKATLAVITMYYGVAMWNSWFWASQLIGDRTQMPLSVVLRDILINSQMQQMDSGVTNAEAIKYALIVVATVPILCVYPFVQRYFTQGVMIGAVKE